MKCLNCNKEISDKAKYCSDKCRMSYVRANKKQPEHEQTPEQTAPEQPTRTDEPTLNTPEHLKEYTDHCHFCNHKFGTALDGEQLMGYICANCITRAMNSEK